MMSSKLKLGCWSIPKTLRDEQIYHIEDTKRVEDEKHFLLDFLALARICSWFHKICHTSNLLDLLSHQNYSDLGAFLSLLFY